MKREDSGPDDAGGSVEGGLNSGQLSEHHDSVRSFQSGHTGYHLTVPGGPSPCSTRKGALPEESQPWGLHGRAPVQLQHPCGVPCFEFKRRTPPF